MNEQQMKALLDSSGIPFVYHVWVSPPALPWGVFRVADQDSFFADGEIYYAVRRYQIELYTNDKSPDIEIRLEQTLTAAGISFSKSEYYIKSERLYEILYECEV